jgi:hypothetical protein
MGKKVPASELARTKRVFEAAKGNVNATSRVLKLRRSTVQHRLQVLGLWSPGKPKGKPKSYKVEARPAGTHVVLMTAMQDDTDMFPGFANLQAYAAARGGDIFVGGFTYNKKLYTDHETRHAHFHHDAAQYLRPDIVQLAPRLVWYGDFNCLPTAADPLSGWETNTKEKWAVFPHAKIALKAVPAMPGRPGKQIMTTGVMTKPNYIAKNAGQKAEFHHTHGATIAEIRPDGTFFLRQLHMTRDGSFQDLDVLVKDGQVLPAPPVEAINWGDIHTEEIDPDVAMACWGYDVDRRAVKSTGSILDTLRPRHQFFHDSFDMKARSHHTRNDPHERAMRIVEGINNVETMLDQTSQFLHAAQRDWCKSVHVASNHNFHLDQWLKDPQGAFDPTNALIWHELNAAYHRGIREGDIRFSVHAWALQHRRWDLSDIAFLKEGESYVICQTTQPVECGLHAHMGPRGARGSPSNLSKIVERINGGHIHEPRIVEGAYFAGTSSKLDMIYNTRGPTAWHHSLIVTYGSGKRTIVTLQDGAYRA